ncbi:MAG TPA: glycosyltransferase family 2 protein, partial [Bacillota bacterium]
MRVATVIPAFNEEKNLPQVLNAIKDCRDLTEVIVVNDGSSDRTSEVAKGFGCKVIDLPSNLGKGAAVMAGVKATDAPY